MTRPDVVVLAADGEFYDATARAWKASSIKPLTAEAKPRPLHHSATCIFRRDPTIAEVCPCTRKQRDYRAQHPH